MALAGFPSGFKGIETGPQFFPDGTPNPMYLPQQPGGLMPQGGPGAMPWDPVTPMKQTMPMPSMGMGEQQFSDILLRALQGLETSTGQMLTPEQQQAEAQSIFGPQEQRGHEQLLRFAGELGGQRGLFRTDTPIADPLLRARSELSQGFGAQQAQHVANLRQQAITNRGLLGQLAQGATGTVGQLSNQRQLGELQAGTQLQLGQLDAQTRLQLGQLDAETRRALAQPDTLTQIGRILGAVGGGAAGAGAVVDFLRSIGVMGPAAQKVAQILIPQFMSGGGGALGLGSMAGSDLGLAETFGSAALGGPGAAGFLGGEALGFAPGTAAGMEGMGLGGLFTDIGGGGAGLAGLGGAEVAGGGFFAPGTAAALEGSGAGGLFGGSAAAGAGGAPAAGAGGAALPVAMVLAPIIATIMGQASHDRKVALHRSELPRRTQEFASKFDPGALEQAGSLGEMASAAVPALPAWERVQESMGQGNLLGQLDPMANWQALWAKAKGFADAEAAPSPGLAALRDLYNDPDAGWGQRQPNISPQQAQNFLWQLLSAQLGTAPTLQGIQQALQRAQENRSALDRGSN